MVDDCHATGFIGPMEEEQQNITNNSGIDVHITGVFKLRRCYGGIYFVKKIVRILRQKSRPYLFQFI